MKTKKETQNLIKEIKESMKHLGTLKQYKFEIIKNEYKIIKNEYSYDILITNPKFKIFYSVIFEKLNKIGLIFYVENNEILIYNSTFLRGETE